ncbi:MAG: hypothetical protein QY310_11750 [Candidatus Jettenia sp. CY-1]|nr:MAG: hypothetical protein QY310_11750 [Candidatus Jettenia sp. CY-1]
MLITLRQLIYDVYYSVVERSNLFRRINNSCKKRFYYNVILLRAITLAMIRQVCVG